ncbi:DUF2938 domain-containing protein [uncultured Psychromonas sp.]|uniref:DUF2938 domain-containing protein n=1 Tax=uncultured Psychromonas sp. TaxID=173974 RepID=UPI0026225414|nr:DUF2938 domain-containing protein [uncultured Psychromonas sp.]
MINETILLFIMIGIGGTIALDIWALLIFKLLGQPGTNWAMVGRWIGHMKSGQFIQPNLAHSAKIPGELAIGWIAHYIIGITFALLLYIFFGEQWIQQSAILPPLIIAWISIAAPFFIMMPGMGAGIAGAKLPTPTIAKIKSVAGHTVFGLGMFITSQAFNSSVM